MALGQASVANQKLKLIVLSGPSGSGKSTVIARALAPGGLPVHLAVSATTRPPRPGEIDGVHYHFWTPERFEQAIRNGELLEWAEVHGYRYGTLRNEVEAGLQQGRCVLLEIDVQGARQIRRQYPNSLTVFLRTSSLEEYERRLRQRHTEEEAAIQRRLAVAQQELACAQEYDVELINDQLDEAVRAFREILARCCGGSSRVR